MQNRSKAEARRSVLLSVVVLGLLSALIILPYQFRSSASVDESAKRGLLSRTESHVPGLENYDIRDQKSEEVAEALMRFRQQSGKSASDLADKRQEFVRGEEALRTRVESLKVEYSRLMGHPEVITPDVYKATIERLTGPSGAKNADTLRNFARQYDQLIGVDSGQIDQLKVIADYTNPRGNMAFAHLSQEINEIPVFAGELKAGFTTRGEIVRVINNLAPGLDYDSMSVDFGDPAAAVRVAADNINYKLQAPDVTRNDAASTDNKVVFGDGDWATTAERMYFPTEIGVARPSWRVLIWQPVNAFYVIVDAETGTVLWRKNITEDQTTSATYQVYTSNSPFTDAADSPAPLTPGPVDPNTGQQGVIIPSRTSRVLIGNEPPNWGMNDLGWMTDGTNFTDGNNVEAGLDRDGTNGVDAPQPGDGMCPGPGCREFTTTWNPPPGNPPPGDDPLMPQAQRGGVIQMFYVVNRYHDTLYSLGFDEAAGNFQDSNFGRGGVGGDRVSAEGQDSSGTNGANMATPADGARPRMQMFIWTGPDPDRDGMADADVMIHEITHGLSNRLHGNTTGLSTNMARGMGEGWSDWYAHTMLAEPSDPNDAIFALGGYITYVIFPGFEANYYYGIRRFPKAVIAFRGGPGTLPHNPLTFANLNAGNCSTFNSAFPRGPIGTAQCDQVHNAGEIWSSALWEVRALMVDRHGYVDGSTRALQVVTDGMKLSPLNPTFLHARDAIIIAASTLPLVPETSSDVIDVREGFRRRGMGISAQILSTSPANVVEAFDLANPRADFDGDGRTDLSVFRPNEGNWYVNGSTSGFTVINWGLAGDTLVPGDYDGDGKADMAVFRPSDTPGVPDFYILNSNGFTYSGAEWGSTADTPVVGDFSGDGKADLAVFRPSNNLWYIFNRGEATFVIYAFGATGDTPMAMDHDGDGKANIAVFRPGNNTWYIARASGLPATNFDSYPFGLASDRLVPADYDGDGKDDVAVFRPGNGTWYILNSGSGMTSIVPFGTGGDIPVPGDYDGDGKYDIAIYRNGTWWLNQSTSGVSVGAFGLASDVPIPGRYIP